MISDLLAEVQRHTAETARGTPRCYAGQCPVCGLVPDPTNPFRPHDRRARTFWIVVDRLVRKVLSAVVRFVCPRCGGRFTDLPPFAYPHKRYVRSRIVGSCERYTEDDRATYRWSSRERGLPIFHDGPAGGEPDHRALAPSTVWRWIRSLSHLRATLGRALEMIRARSPSCSIFRRALLVPPRKYRSQERRQQLECTRLLIHTDREYRPLFGGSIFPGVATASGWR